MKAVLDTNVIVSAAINPKGPPAEILRKWRADSFIWVISPGLLAEVRRVILSPQIKQYLNWDEAEVIDFLSAIPHIARMVSPKRKLQAVKNDPADDQVIEAAVAADVDYIVSGDRDLLNLKVFEGIPIITPARFLAVLATTSANE